MAFNERAHDPRGVGGVRAQEHVEVPRGAGDPVGRERVRAHDREVYLRREELREVFVHPCAHGHGFPKCSASVSLRPGIVARV